MSVISISDVLARLTPSKTKVYQRLYDTFGYELGVGRAGSYPGHAHLYFCDLMFSPTGIRTAADDSTPVRGRLVVVPPRTYFGDTTIGDFFFLKFCPYPGPISVPDKIDTHVKEGPILAYHRTADIRVAWFSSSVDPGSAILVTLRSRRLELRFGDLETVVVEP
jgi:hypothetical protein